jgi:diguanylate cyclase (GGDEF)-like protein
VEVSGVTIRGRRRLPSRGSEVDVAREEPSPGRRNRRVGVSWYLFATFGVAILLLAAMVWASTASAYNRARRDSLGKLATAATLQADAVASKLNTSATSLGSIVSSSGAENLDRPACSATLAGLTRLVPGAVPAVLVHTDGSVVCTSDARVATSAAWSSVADLVRGSISSGRPLLHPGVRNLLDGKPAVLIVVRLVGARVPTYLTAMLPYGVIFQAPSASLPATEQYLLISSDRRTVLAGTPRGAFSGGESVGSAGVAQPLPSGAVSVTGVDGVPRIYRDAIVPGYGWRVLIGASRHATLGAAQSDRWRGLLLGLLMIAVVGILGILLFRALVRPVQRLRAAIEAAGTDNSVRAKLEGPAEIAGVAEAFNETAARRQELEIQLSHQALHDPLTGLPNRALLSDRLTTSLARQRRSGEPVAVCFLDLDRFKNINDSQGHPAGDQILVALAERLLSAVRPSDTVARFGGDEFIVVTEGVNDAADASHLAQRLSHALTQPFLLAGEKIYVSGTVGIAIA